MLTIVLPATDDSDAVELQLEHSLVSLSKWESIHEKAFYGREEKTEDEMIDYVNQMIVGGKPPENFVDRLSQENTTAIMDYINSKQTATWFREDKSTKGSAEVITNELIYYWMISFQIPFDPCQNWHINRLMTLIKICGIKQTKPKKMSKQEQAEQYRMLNAQRRAKLGTAG